MKKFTQCGKKSGTHGFERAADLWIARIFVKGDVWPMLDLNSVGTRRAFDTAMREEVKSLMWALKNPDAGETPEERVRLGRENASTMNYMDMDSRDICCNSTCGVWFRTVRKKIGLQEVEACPESFIRELETREAEDNEERAALFPEPFRSNIRAFAEAFGLTQDESDALAFLLIARFHEPLKELLEYFDFAAGGARLLAEVLSVALGKEMSEKLFSADGTLMSTGLLHLCKASEEELDDRFELLGDDDQCGSVMNEQISPEAFYSRRIVRAPKANLTLDDYSHIPAVKNLLIPYLAKVLQTRKTGVNILIYGPPGTGKTELTRTAAEAIGAKLYEIGPLRNAEKENGERSRITRWNIAEKLYRSSEKTLLVIDESEDIINEGAVFTIFGGPKRSNKAELNKLVEIAPVPTFWLTNTLGGMDPALIRRFDIVLEVPIPPENVRRRIAESEVGNLVSADMIDRLALSGKLSPAVISRTASVIADLNLEDEKARDEACETLLSASLDAQSLGRLPGRSEALICEAFEEAKRAGALLLIDEADSFLRDRELSQRSWEVTQVNELLTQMESFPGIFCATTNLFENIDRAALRRFDLKAKFDFLRPEQRLGLLERHLAALGLGTDGVKSLVTRLSALDCITPGDFAAIERGSAFSPIQSAEEFLRRLEDDSALKNEGRKKPRIGF